MTTAPIVRVVMPHEVVQTYWRWPSSPWNWMSKAFAKFCPRLCEVHIWSALPSCIIASRQYVRSAPGNFSRRDFTPL